MSPRLIATGKWLIARLEALRIPIQPRIDSWMERMAIAEKEREQQGFAADTDFAILQQEPLRARVLYKTIGVAFAIALAGYAAYVINATQFILKLRAARLHSSPRQGTNALPSSLANAK